MSIGELLTHSRGHEGPTVPLPGHMAPSQHPTAAGPAAGELAGLSEGAALLVVTRGPHAGSRYLLDRDITTAGRYPESDIVLDTVTVSRCHAEVHRVGAEFVLLDLNSFNGTYLNRHRVDTAVLIEGDEVQIGLFRLRFRTGAGQAAARGPGSGPALAGAATP